MTDRPMAVVFQDEFGGTYETWVPAGFTVVVAQGGILVIHQEKLVSGILSVRPVGGEAHAAEGEQQQQGNVDHLGDPGREREQHVPDQAGGPGREGAGDPGQGDEVHQRPDGSDGDGDRGAGAGDHGVCTGHVVFDIESESDDDWYYDYCSSGLGCNGPKRTPDSDDEPGVTV